jgi:thiamine-monophosphate kinase
MKSAFSSEFELIEWLRQNTPARARGVRLGIGDDAALVRISPARELTLKADMSIEGVHFLRSVHPPRSVGHRALARALSDIAAMGGAPRFALVSLALAQSTPRAWIEQFFEGLLALAKRFRVQVVGGDTATVHESTLVDVVVAGEIEPGLALRRSAARPGDALFVSGRLGLSALGLALLRSGHRLHPPVSKTTREPAASARHALEREAIRAHLYPEPRCALGRFLATRRLASAAIDVSDGFSTDLGHLARASGVGAQVLAARLPSPKTLSETRRDPLQLALHGGEDYELLFTVRPGKVSKVPRRFDKVALHQVGEIQESAEVVLLKEGSESEILRPAGWDAFNRR